MKVKVGLNGTETNPFERYGLGRNPFPQTGKHEYARLDEALTILAATPMPTIRHLVEKLAELGGSKEFNAACMKMYQPGKMVTFYVEFPDA